MRDNRNAIALCGMVEQLAVMASTPKLCACLVLRERTEGRPSLRQRSMRNPVLQAQPLGQQQGKTKNRSCAVAQPHAFTRSAKVFRNL
ncbi:MAG: hypothetical protein RLZZ484_1246 [Pseudomonadota bacterium]|jgi:hypothetical protein